MKKPRIILADPDPSYIAPLQLKFVQMFFNQIELEIITQRDYYESLFSTPQKADVLIVSEDFYDHSVRKHNIGKIFLLAEQPDQGGTGDLNVDRIFKYTSIKEIVNEIIGKSPAFAELGSLAKREPQIIVTYSAQGGVGKTTLSLGICGWLAKNFKKVLYINASRLQSFQYLLENRSVITSPDVYTKLSHPDVNLYRDIQHVIRKEQFSYLPAFRAALMSLGISYSVFEKLAVSAQKSGDYDFIIVDAESSFDEGAAGLLNVADKVIVVTDQSYSSVYATNVLVSNINGINNDKYIFICNNFTKENDNALISPDITPKFTVNDYVEHIYHMDKLKCADLAKESGIQKTAFLVM